MQGVALSDEIKSTLPPELAESVARAPFRIEPIGRNIGAEIHDLDLSETLSEECVSAFEAALITYKVVYLRDQNISSVRHVEIGRLFGDLETHPFRPQGELPELVKLDNHKDNPVLSTDVWHTDTTFRRCPTKYSILRCIRIPDTGGDTLWADMTAAYNELSESLKSFIDGLRAVHDFRNFRVLYGNSDEERAELRKMEELYPNPLHPVVRTHPVTGQKAIFVNANFTIRIDGMRSDESQALLDLLCAQAKIPEFQFRLRWHPGTIVFWDNRCTQHYATNDYYPDRRTMERVAVIGDEPF